MLFFVLYFMGFGIFIAGKETDARLANSTLPLYLFCAVRWQEMSWSQLNTLPPRQRSTSNLFVPGCA
jgi:hypothetical protein